MSRGHTATCTATQTLERHSDMILSIEIMFMNKIPIMMNKSGNINFGMAELANTIMKSLRQVLHLYQGRDFTVFNYQSERRCKHTSA